MDPWSFSEKMKPGSAMLRNIGQVMLQMITSLHPRTPRTAGALTMDWSWMG
jgi:hypothetical protein